VNVCKNIAREKKRKTKGIVKISSILRHWKKWDRCDWFADARPSRPTPPFSTTCGRSQ